MEKMFDELQQEAATTRRVLERVPEDKLAWKPHPKSMTLGQLAMHIASIPANLSKLAQLDEFEASQANFQPPQPSSLQEILATLDQAVAAAAGYLKTLTPEQAAGIWCLKVNGRTIFSMQRENVLRTILLNHWYHHRGQLTVYLRLLDVSVPVIYGRSADENPFA